MFVVYHKETTRRLDLHTSRCKQECFATRSAAKATLTYCSRVDPTKVVYDEFDIAASQEFYEKIERQVVKKHLLTGNPFTIGINAPACIDPSTETYHCM